MIFWSGCAISSRGLYLNPEDIFQALSELTTASDAEDHSNIPLIMFPFGFHAIPLRVFPVSPVISSLFSLWTLSLSCPLNTNVPQVLAQALFSLYKFPK